MNTGFNVAPRYTGGSPALVDERTAERVAEQEAEAFAHAKSGIYGAAFQKRANTEGLALIAYQMTERRKGWEVYDLITKAEEFWPFKARCPRCNARVACRRGHLQEHRAKDRVGECDGGALSMVEQIKREVTQ